VGSLMSIIEGKILEKDEKDRVIIDLNNMGYDKLLGSGKIDLPVVIKVKQASEIAKRKITEAGGEVILIN
ncbi:MAG: uL15 family ribosomal protein, partial [Candidatus Methanomethyliaceae archaeon]